MSLYNLSISNLSASDYKLAKSVFSFFKSAFVVELDKSNSIFTFTPKEFCKIFIHLYYVFFINPTIKKIIVSFPFNI